MDVGDEKPRGGAFVLALALYALAMCLTAMRTRPIVPRSADAPADEFSGVRAKALLQQLVGNGVPHPVGSTADAAVRDAIVARLTQVGYQPRVQEDFVCDSNGACADVKNILGRLDGQQSGPAVMVAAHYDSVPAGPGASDDGAGTVSVLEIARALKASPAMRHPVIFLIDEGEEAGLLGAAAFVQDDPWAKDVSAVVNMDNRGTSGPSTMFETGSANEWLMRMYAKSVQHPNADSLSYTVYKTLPNDTDFTVFRAAKYQGFNFAFLDDVAHYHTPLDNVANTSVSSIQSEGGSALDTVRALANLDLNSGAASDAVYQDLLGWRMVWWPARWTIGLALLALTLLILEIAVLARRGQVRMRGLLVGFVSWPLVLIVAGILGAALQFFLSIAGATPSNWVAHPVPLLIAAWALGFAAVALIAALLGRAAGLWGMWSGTWLWWGIVSLVLGALAPGLSFIFVVSAVATGILGLAILFARGESSAVVIVAAVIPGLVTALAGVYTVWFLYAGLGGTFLAGITVCVALVALPLAPLTGAVSVGRWKFSVVTFAVAVIATAAALVVAPYSLTSPEALNLQYRQDADSGRSQWLAYPASGRLPITMRSVAKFARTDVPVNPWEATRPLGANAPALNLAPPVLDIDRGGLTTENRTNYDVTLKSQRGAPVILLAFPPAAKPESVTIAGHAVPEISRRILTYTHGWRIYRCVDTPPEGIEVEFSLTSTKPVSVLLLDESYGLPPEGAFLKSARPAAATQIQNGDTTVLARHVTLEPPILKR
ncbi:MAG TPA: M20/M25/M40 family metallo-hydrolase [Candidatus Acidoferrales bacterium]|nr:M20/M25/M40 family metallo-hydrolase [Candidatus Acidoferrales bacterium]